MPLGVDGDVGDSGTKGGAGREAAGGATYLPVGDGVRTDTRRGVGASSCNGKVPDAAVGNRGACPTGAIGTFVCAPCGNITAGIVGCGMVMEVVPKNPCKGLAQMITDMLTALLSTPCNHISSKRRRSSSFSPVHPKKCFLGNLGTVHAGPSCRRYLFK